MLGKKNTKGEHASGRQNWPGPLNLRQKSNFNAIVGCQAYKRWMVKACDDNAGRRSRGHCCGENERKEVTRAIGTTTLEGVRVERTTEEGRRN